jgi:hypothetical protein
VLLGDIKKGLRAGIRPPNCPEAVFAVTSKLKITKKNTILRAVESFETAAALNIAKASD